MMLIDKALVAVFCKRRYCTKTVIPNLVRLPGYSLCFIPTSTKTKEDLNNSSIGRASSVAVPWQQHSRTPWKVRPLVEEVEAHILLL
jgi:hypothetical protein